MSEPISLRVYTSNSTHWETMSESLINLGYAKPTILTMTDFMTVWHQYGEERTPNIIILDLSVSSMSGFGEALNNITRRCNQNNTVLLIWSKQGPTNRHRLLRTWANRWAPATTRHCVCKYGMVGHHRLTLCAINGTVSEMSCAATKSQRFPLQTVHTGDYSTFHYHFLKQWLQQLMTKVRNLQCVKAVSYTHLRGPRD